MEKTTAASPPSPLRGLVLFSADMWFGSAVITAASYLLFRWSADFFSLSAFWGYEPGQFGQFVNVMKTAAIISLILALIAVGIDGKISRLSHSFLHGYGFLGNQSGPPIKNKKVREIRILSGAGGGSLFTLLIAILLLPFFSELDLLPNNLTLAAEPFQFNSNSIGSEGIIIEPGESIESTIEENFFTVHVDGGGEFFILIEPVDKNSGHYGLSSSFAQGTREEYSVKSSGGTFDNRFDWVIVSPLSNDRLDFDVYHTGNGPPSSYRVHVFKNLYKSPGIVNVSSLEFENAQNNHTYQFQAENETPYIIVAWPNNEAEGISINLDEENGRNYPAAHRSQMDVALLKPSQSGTYDITVRNPHGHLSNGYKLLILSPGTTNDSTTESSLNFIGIWLLCNIILFILILPFILLTFIHKLHADSRPKNP